MKKHIPLLLLLLLELLNSPGYAQGWQWGRGNTGGGMDSWCVATDLSGNVFTGGMNFSRGIGSLGVIPSVFGNKTIPFVTTGLDDYQSIITKYDANGNFLWGVGTQNGSSYTINIATDKYGNTFLLGAITGPSLQIGSFTLTNTIYAGSTVMDPGYQYFLAKLDPDGNVLWARNAGSANIFNKQTKLAGTPTDSIAVIGVGGIATDDTGNVVITTSFNLPQIDVGPYILTNTDPTGATSDLLLVKYDSLGNIMWAKSIGGTGDENVYGLTVTPLGDVYIAGQFNSPLIKFGATNISSTNSVNAFIARFSSTGEPKWASASGGQGNEYAAGVASDAHGNVYLTGGVSDASISFNGTTITNSNPGIPELFLVKFNTFNNVLWSKTITSPTGGAWGFAIAMSPCGAIWVSGAFSNSISIDGHTLIADNDAQSDPVFIAGYDVNGTYAGGASLQSGADDQNGIACDALGNVYICADYQTYQFIVGKDTLADVKSAEQGEWQYLAKYAFVNVDTKDTSFLHQTERICANAPVALNAPAGHPSYLWDNGSTAASITVTDPGTYWVIGNGGCTLIDTIIVANDGNQCECNAILPNAFTPNNDGIDDFYHPLFSPDCQIGSYSFAIYNRWGQRVFSSQDPNERWDGKFNGANAEMDVYMYYCRYRSGQSSVLRSYKGDVTLIR